MICQGTNILVDEPARNAAVVRDRSARWNSFMRTINVLATQRISADDRAKIEASDPAIRLIDAGGWFDGEIGETWTAFAATRHLPPGATGAGSRTRTHVREAFQQRRCLVPVEQFL
jgi:hypothetical protein